MQAKANIENKTNLVEIDLEDLVWVEEESLNHLCSQILTTGWN